MMYHAIGALGLVGIMGLVVAHWLRCWKLGRSQ